MKIIKLVSFLLMAVLFSGSAFSISEDPDERKHYTASLNSMASVVMKWYSHVLKTKKTYLNLIGPKNRKNYVTHYPDNIAQIEITGTNLVQLKTSNQYQFIVEIKFSYKQKNTVVTQSMSDNFLFGINEPHQLKLQKITSTKPQPSDVISDNIFTSSYFNSREIAYTWLSYLDAATLPKNLKKQFDQVSYSLKLGNLSWQGPAISILNKRQNYLAVGSHLLRVVKMQPNTQSSNLHFLDLTIAWRGEDKDGIPVQANIHQTIEYTLLENGDWKIISVKEKHLLPDTKPWIGLLC